MADLDLSMPFTRAEALAAGLTDWQLRRHQLLHRDMYVGAGVRVDSRIRALAAIRLAPVGTLVARHTAAELLGGVVPPSPLVHLLLPSGRLRVRGIDARVGRRLLVGRIRKVPVTTAEDTFVELGEELGLVDLVVLGDSLVKAGRTTPASLVDSATRAASPQGPTLRRAAGLVRDRVDSPMESRLRMLLVLAGLPEPVVNFAEHDEGGWVRRRFDLSYPAHRLAIEYDGRQHAQSQAQWEHDVERREGLDSDEWRLVVVLAKGIYREPDRTLERVVAAMGDVGMNAEVSSDEWRVHFPGQSRRPA